MAGIQFVQFQVYGLGSVSSDSGFAFWGLDLQDFPFRIISISFDSSFILSEHLSLFLLDPKLQTLTRIDPLTRSDARYSTINFRFWGQGPGFRVLEFNPLGFRVQFCLYSVYCLRVQGLESKESFGGSRVLGVEFRFRVWVLKLYDKGCRIQENRQEASGFVVKGFRFVSFTIKHKSR